MIALEFQPGNPGTFHFNYTSDRKKGGYEHEILSNRYVPITILPDRAAHSKELGNLMDGLVRENAGLGTVVRAVYEWASQHENLWNE